MKDFQIIYVKYNKDKLINTLLIYNLKLFGMGNHIIVVDNKPKGINISPHAKVANARKIIQKPKVQQQMKASQAKLIKFTDKDFQILKRYFNKNYISTNKKSAKSSLSYKSRTQKAHFVLYKNGHLSTSKDLLDMDLIINIIRILKHKKPLSISNAVK